MSDETYKEIHNYSVTPPTLDNANSIIGLAIAITCALLMLFGLQDELSWDSFQQNKDTLFLVEQEFLSW